ncbi:hypothetical protein [Streptomyces sp. NPDC005549]|uniref:hypothetical protein n=1 Tax=Streptomyces sp. NPDC005549 TaxID=3154888 RepID=UPI00339E16B5
MPKFRKKPVEIDAIQLTSTNLAAVLGFISDGPDATVDIRATADGPSIDIPTLGGTMTALPNDWIIRGVKGELYPCKPDIFEATYESVPTPRTEMHIEFRPDPPHVADAIRDIRRNGPPPTRR